MSSYVDVNVERSGEALEWAKENCPNYITNELYSEYGKMPSIRFYFVLGAQDEILAFYLKYGNEYLASSKNISEGRGYITYSWKKWFAWRPVKVKGDWKWLTYVLRKPIPKTYVNFDDWQRYEYGDIFDVLKS